MVFVAIAVFIVLLYWLTMILFVIGWRKTFPPATGSSAGLVPISVIVVVRNEEQNILDLLYDLSVQEYPQSYFEVILIDDFSTDGTYEKVQLFVKRYAHFSMERLRENRRGKKQGLLQGILSSKNELILTTDGDSRVKKRWLQAVCNRYLETRATLIVGPVYMEGGFNLFDVFQTLEFTSLIVATGGAIGVGMPIMCNGANLCFCKKEVLGSTDPLKINIYSGDDIFLLHRIKKNDKGKIVFLKSPDAIVTVSPVKSVKGFLQQRIRWAGKSRYYKDRETIFVGMSVVVMNMVLFVLLVWSVFDFFYFSLFCVVFILKSIADFPLLFVGVSFFTIRKRFLFLFPLFQFVYIVYINFTFVVSNISSYEWKGRKVKR